VLKNYLPKGLFARSLLIVIFPLLIVYITLIYSFIERHTETILKLLAQDIVGDAAVVLYLVENDMNFDSIQNLALHQFRFRVTLHPTQQQILPKNSTNKQKITWPYNFLHYAFSKKLTTPYFIDMDDETLFLKIYSKKGIILIKIARKRFFSRTTPFVVIFVSITTLLMMIISSFFMRNLVRPIKKLAKAAEQFGKGDEHFPFTPSGSKEVKQAGIAFLTMRERLKRQLKERFEMMAYISHDLRTPITRIKLQLACMAQNQDTDGLKKDVNQMQSMIEGFLNYARLQEEEPSYPTELYLFLQEIVDGFSRSNFPITLNCPSDLIFCIKRYQFERSITNFLSNAQKYASTAFISVKQEMISSKASIHIFIEDDGPGIPEHERENVFRPFYRVDQSRNLDTEIATPFFISSSFQHNATSNSSNSPNIGLGLSIAKDIIVAHGGTVTLTESTHFQKSQTKKKEPGLLVHICIPK
jgi:two-component system osmolarity sensor histidine kinase EnvZ